MNRRNFIKYSALGLLGLSNVCLAKESKGHYSKNGLGKYKKHKIEGEIYFSKTDGHTELVLFHNGCWDDEIVNNYTKKLQYYVTFPIENRLIIEFEQGIETYICYNLRKAEFDRLQNPDNLFEELGGNTKWKLNYLTYTKHDDGLFRYHGLFLPNSNRGCHDQKRS